MEALLGGAVAGGVEDFGVEGEGAGEEGVAVPVVEVDGVPPVHFEVEFAEPGVAEEAGFLGGVFAGAVDGGEVLGEDDAAFEFGAGVGAVGEVDGGTGGPEVPPGLVGGDEGVGERIEGGGVGGLDIKRDAGFEHVLAGRPGDLVTVGSDLPDRPATSRRLGEIDTDTVAGGVHGTVERDLIGQAGVRKVVV